MYSGSSTSEEEFVLAYKKPRLDTNTSDSNEDDEDSSVDETVPLCSLIKFPMEFPELESELLTQISEPEPEPKPKPKPKAAKSNSKPKPKQKPKQKSTPKAKPKATPEPNSTIDTKPTPVSTIEAGNSEMKEDVSNPAPPRPVLSAKQQEKLDAGSRPLRHKTAISCLPVCLQFVISRSVDVCCSTATILSKHH